MVCRRSKLFLLRVIGDLMSAKSDVNGSKKNIGDGQFLLESDKNTRTGFKNV